MPPIERDRARSRGGPGYQDDVQSRTLQLGAAQRRRSVVLPVFSSSHVRLQAMSKPQLPQPLSRLLASDPLVAGWLARALAEARLTTAVRRLLPRALAERVYVANASDGSLTLATGSGTIAAVVRQRLPEILGELKREGCNFTEIRVRVQVRGDAPKPEQNTENSKGKGRSSAFAPVGGKPPGRCAQGGGTTVGQANLESRPVRGRR